MQLAVRQHGRARASLLNRIGAYPTPPFLLELMPMVPAMRRRSFRLFVPILAGATLRERAIGCLGALVGIGLTALICGALYGGGAFLSLIVAPMGASAVLLFAVPSSPLAQPWPIIGGNTISALVGVVTAHFISDPAFAAALAVALAVAAMSLTRSLHPPGGAAALTAVIGGPAVAASGFLFPFVPVALNSIVLVALGLGFHRIFRRAYPHAAMVGAGAHGTSDQPALARVGFLNEDVDAALVAMGETFDIDRQDLERILKQVEIQATMREHRTLTCGDIMSCDVVTVDLNSSASNARALLIGHNIRTLPVVDSSGALMGTIGLRELTSTETTVGAQVVPAVTAKSFDPAFSLIPSLTDGKAHAVVIVTDDSLVSGLVTQTDLLAALAAVPVHTR